MEQARSGACRKFEALALRQKSDQRQRHGHWLHDKKKNNPEADRDDGQNLNDEQSRETPIA